MWILFALALAVRAAYFWSVWDAPAVRYAMGDAEAYQERALAILAGQWFEDDAFYQDPLYPYFLALSYAIFGAGFGFHLCVQALLSSLTAVLIYWIGLRVFGAWSGALAGVFAALYGPLLYYDALLLKVSLSLFLVTVAFVLLLRADRVDGSQTRPSLRGLAAWLAAGYSFGLATLTRGNYLVFVPVLLLWVGWVRGAQSRRRLSIAVVTVGLALAIAPVTIHNAVVSGDFVLITSQAGQNFYIGNYRDNRVGVYIPPPFARAHPRYEQNDMRDEAERRVGHPLSPSERSVFWFREGLAEIAADPAHAKRLVLRKLRLFASDYEAPDNYSFDYFRDELSAVLRLPLPTWGIVFPLSIVGLISGYRNRRAWLLTLYVLTYVLTLVLFYMASRYRMPVIPAVLVFAGEGARQIFGALRSGRWRLALPVLLLLASAWWLVYRPVTNQGRAFALARLKLGVHHARRAEEARMLADERAAAGDDAGVEAARLRDEEFSARAEHELRHALDAQPRNHNVQLALLKHMLLRIEALQALGEDEEALETAQRLARALPERPVVQAVLGAAYAQLGHEDRARAILKRALAKWPRNPRVRSGWDRLQAESE